jgi:hypothetical protein
MLEKYVEHKKDLLPFGDHWRRIRLALDTLQLKKNNGKSKALTPRKALLRNRAD